MSSEQWEMNSGDELLNESLVVITETSGVVRSVSKTTSLVSARMHNKLSENGMTASRGDKPVTTGQSFLPPCGSESSRFGTLDSGLGSISVFGLATDLFLQQFLQAVPTFCVTTGVTAAGG